MQNNMSRQEMFEKAKQRYKEERERQSTGSSFSANYEEVHYTALDTEVDKIVRLTGAPIWARSLPTDPKLSSISLITGDNGKMFRCIWPNKEDDYTWLLWKIYTKIMSYSKNYDTDVITYHHAEEHPELFKRVAKNNSEHRYATGWKPIKYVHFNVIDRADMEFHRENQKLKVLSKKASERGGNIWFDPGVPEYLYKTIFDEVVEYSGDWENYDIVFRKLSGKPFYKAFHAIDDLKRIQDHVKEFIVEGDMTEEERSWEGYDFDKIYPITSYNKIKKNLSKFIQQFDLTFNTKYYEELCDLAAEEERERKANASNDDSSGRGTYDSEVEDDVEAYDVESEPAPKAPTRSVKTRSSTTESKSIPWDKLASGEFNGTKYLGVPKMTDEEKAMVVSINDDGSFKYVSEWEGEEMELLSNPDNKFISPDRFHVDPLSGDEFE